MFLFVLLSFYLDGIAKGYEAFERMAFYGVASNLVVYLTTQLHEDNVSSVRNVNNWSGAVWMTPILGAYVADSYLGRFWTFTVSSLIYALVRRCSCIFHNQYYVKSKLNYNSYTQSFSFWSKLRCCFFVSFEPFVFLKNIRK